jgi:hypothetical protein
LTWSSTAPWTFDATIVVDRHAMTATRLPSLVEVEDKGGAHVQGAVDDHVCV